MGSLRHVVLPSSGLTTASTTYNSGDVLGNEMSFRIPGRQAPAACILRGVVVTDLSGVIGDLDLFFFDRPAHPAADNAAVAWDVETASLVGDGASDVDFSGATAAALVGSGATDDDFTDENVTFYVAWDGGDPVKVELNDDYTNAAGVVAEINTQLGETIATQNTGTITLTSPTTGLGSSIAISEYTEWGTASAALEDGEDGPGTEDTVTFTLTIDGVDHAIVLDDDYDDGDGLVAAINAQVEGSDPATHSNATLTFTSPTAGAAGSVAVSDIVENGSASINVTEGSDVGTAGIADLVAVVKLTDDTTAGTVKVVTSGLSDISVPLWSSTGMLYVTAVTRSANAVFDDGATSLTYKLVVDVC